MSSEREESFRGLPDPFGVRPAEYVKIYFAK
jgi:hypothetical protein